MEVERESCSVGSGDGSGGSGCRDEVSFVCDGVDAGLLGELGEISWRGAGSEGIALLLSLFLLLFLSWLASVDLRWRSSSSGTRGALVIGGCGSAEWYRGLTSTLSLNEYVGFLICCCLMGFGCRRSVRTPSVAGLHASHPLSDLLSDRSDKVRGRLTFVSSVGNFIKYG